MVGKEIGYYRIQRLIAGGGMGTVYEAQQEEPRRPVALKLMKRGVAEPERVSEARPTAHVSARGYLVPNDLPESRQEWYEERAAIREYDGGQAREHAEAEALQETLNAMRAAGKYPEKNQ